MNRLGIEFLTVLGLPPVDFVRLAGKLECRHISAMLDGSYVNPNDYPAFDLRTDRAMRADFMSALQDEGVSISLGEGFLVRADGDVRALTGDLDLMRSLGATRVNIVSMDPDLQRTLDQYAIFAELAASAGMEEVVIEFAPVLTIRDLPMAVEAVRHVGRPDFRLLIDTMHLCRTGGTAADIAALDPALIGYIQLCDAPSVPPIDDYMQESMTERLSPGEGDFPLADIFAALPDDRIVSLEVPQCAKALAGQSRRERIEPMLAATRDLLARIRRPD